MNWLASSQTAAPWSGYLGIMKQERGTWETWPHLTPLHSVARGKAAGAGGIRSRVGIGGQEAEEGVELSPAKAAAVGAPGPDRASTASPRSHLWKNRKVEGFPSCPAFNRHTPVCCTPLFASAISGHPSAITVPFSIRTWYSWVPRARGTVVVLPLEHLFSPV